MTAMRRVKAGRLNVQAGSLDGLQKRELPVLMRSNKSLEMDLSRG